MVADFWVVAADFGVGVVGFWAGVVCFWAGVVDFRVGVAVFWAGVAVFWVGGADFWEGVVLFWLVDAFSAATLADSPLGGMGFTLDANDLMLVLMGFEASDFVEDDGGVTSLGIGEALGVVVSFLGAGGGGVGASGLGFGGSSAGSVSMGAGISSSSSSSMFELDPEVVGAPLLSTAMSKGCCLSMCWARSSLVRKSMEQVGQG